MTNRTLENHPDVWQTDIRLGVPDLFDSKGLRPTADEIINRIKGLQTQLDTSLRILKQRDKDIAEQNSSHLLEKKEWQEKLRYSIAD